ncbi:MAG: N-acetyltransferase [Rhodospirillaceae bacterium]|jgi:putative acetyltransferase|nr:N-acetyltransferase [Rhodospirillaceae bacterium]MBT3533680.1 N-acetyltransferase [Rhodospirillaceae bacterium]MBT4488978.1 N-acetyltransferase [Rhodospirillaceae bacterium]MBT5192764.1 N-acetyltransferase [Rhodospirillaceae bacterium]MBT5898438.1 N-acetyltransferase [Rhodospirillaceae bacterium]
MIIRAETSDDVARVRHVVLSAFGQADEADLVAALQASGDVEIALVAMHGDQLVGHILFSKLAAPAGCLGLAPVSVLPEFQNQGIGGALIRDGLDIATRKGWQAVFLLGEPAYYERFGFTVAAAHKFGTIYPKPYVMGLELTSGALDALDGALTYAQPFLDLES